MGESSVVQEEPAAVQDDGAGPNELTPEQARMAVGAMSKLVSASVGDLVVVMSRSPAHKHYSLADIEWMVLPPVLANQFHVADAAHKETGARAPVAAITWARVSQEVDRKLTAHTGTQLPRLRPDEWTSGAIIWIIDMVGDPQGLSVAIKQLQETVWQGEEVKVVVMGFGSERTVRVLSSGDLAKANHRQ